MKSNKTIKTIKAIITPVLAVNAVLFAMQTTPVQASLSPISGTISFSGTATTDNNNLVLAKAFTLFQDVVVGAPSALMGAYVGTSGAAVTVTPFTWNPPDASTPIDPLWKFTSAGVTYSFDLISLHVDFVTPTELVLSGWGTSDITGGGTSYAETSGMWSLTAQTFGASTFTFSSTTASTPVPEPSNIVTALFLLVPLGTAGVRILRNRKNGR